MITEIKKKKQGDGRDSWIIKVWETDKKKVLISATIVYEDPDIPKESTLESLQKEIDEIKIKLGL